MNISVTNGDIAINEEEKANIESRLRLSLSRFSSRISRVTVEMSAIAPSATGHKKCRIELFFRPGRRLVVEDTDSDLQKAVDRAAVQMAHSVERKLRRERELGT